jgi:drug/metabolite transporter (DMT)-like permease
MTWIFLATGAQFLNAIVAILDKFIVSDKRMVPKPFVYAFYSCLVTSSWGLVYLLGFIHSFATVGVPQVSNIEWPTIQVVGMSFLAAYTFFMAIVSMYDGLKEADASDVMPVIGAVSAISTFVMAYLFLDVRLTHNFVWGIALLATGTFLVSHVRFTKKIILNTVHSGIFFALHYITMKGLFQETSFDDGFFWSRVGFVFFALSLLLVPVYYEKITKQTRRTTTKAGLFVLSAKILAGVASFMLLKATDWGDVAVVQALDGLKFVFILVISVFVGKYLPISAGENETGTETIVRKILYVSIIALGFVILFT